MSEIPSISPADTPRPLVYYSAKEKLIPRPELAVIGFAVLVIPNVYYLIVVFLFRLVPFSKIQPLITAMNLSLLLLRVGGVVTVLHAFRKSPLRRNWLHFSLLALLAGDFLFHLIDLLTSFLDPPSIGSAAIWAGVISITLFELFYSAFTILWMIFLCNLAAAVRSPVLRVITPLLLIPQILVSWFWTLFRISNNLSFASPAGGPPPLPLSLLGKISAASSIVSLLIAALTIWYAIAVYRFGRKERSLIAPA